MAYITMNSRERVLAAIRRQPVDHVPCSQHVHPLTEVQRRGRPWNFPWAPPGEGEEYMAAVMGTDPVVGLWWMDGVCPAPEVTGRVWREGDLLHKVFETPAGVLHASVLANEQWPYGDDIPLFHDFCGHYREFWIKGERDVACLAHILQPPRRQEELERMRAAFDRGKALAKRLGLATIATVGSGLSSALWLFGAERLCLLTIDDPGLVDAYLEIEHRWNLTILDLVLDWGVDIVQRNGFYESAEFYGPAMLQRFLARRLRKEAAVVHEAGRPFAYTMHSGIMPILDHLAGFDFDCISLFDIAFDSPDLGAVARKLSAMSFWTGPSNTFHMYAAPEVVRQAVRDVFVAFGKTGLILGAASSIHPTMPWENTLAMLEEWRRLR